jgi:hypothetical protein
MDDRQTDYRRWAVWSGVFFLPLWLLVIGPGLDARLLLSPLGLFRHIACVSLFLAVVAVAFGWFVQSVAVAQDGPSGRRPDPQDDDYADRP